MYVFTRVIRGKYSLVPVIQTKLDQASGYHRRRDLSKRRRSSNVHRTRETKNRMVPHVEDIHAESKFMAFLNVSGLDEGEVPVLLFWTTERVAWHRTKVGGAGGTIGHNARSPEARSIQVVSQDVRG